MNSEVFVGLDIHKATIVATAVDRLGHRLDQSKFSSSDHELVAYLERLPGEKHVVMEACSFWEHIYDAAAPVVASVTLSHPRKTRIIAEASLKTDRVDSEALATLLRLEAVPEAFAPPPPLRELRDLVRERVFYSAKEKGVKNHLYGFMMRKGIPYEVGVLGLLKKREELRQHHSPVLDRGLDLLTEFREATKGLDHEIHEAFEKSEEAKLLATIPGVGEITAITLVAYLCPIERFENIDQVSAYCGMCPTTHQSGESSYQGHLRQDAHHVLGWILVEAAWRTRHLEKRGDVAKVGNRSARRHGKGTGSIAAAHKLLKICYAVLRRRTPYEAHAPARSGCTTISADS
jgi:transposase